MKYSKDRILTTHTGSLARPLDLIDLMLKKEQSEDYDPKVFAGNNEQTFKMSSRDINVLARKTGLIHNGCIVGENGIYFYPEEKPLSFGRKTAIVQVSGWFIAGTVA